MTILQQALRIASRWLDLGGMRSAPDIAPAHEARLYYNRTTDQLLASTNGGAYAELGERAVGLATARVFLDALDTQYRVSIDFSDAGEFASAAAWRVAAVAADQPGVLIQEDLANKDAGAGALLVTVPTGAASGDYGDNLQLELTVTLAGRGWTGETVSDVATTWGAPA